VTAGTCGGFGFGFGIGLGRHRRLRHDKTCTLQCRHDRPKWKVSSWLGVQAEAP